MKRIISFLTIISLLFCISSCEKEDDISKLKVSTIDVKKTTYLTVSISGSVSGPSSIIDNAEIGIQISTDEVFGAALSYRQSMDNNDDHNGYSVTVSNLKQGVTYYYRAYCAYQSGFYYGETKTFCFNWDGPNVTTLSATFDANGGIEFVGYIDELGKTLNNMGGYNANTSFGFECSSNSDFVKDSTIILIPDKYYPFLGDSVIWYYYEYQFGKKYYYRTFFKYESFTYYGETKTFNTPSIEVTTGLIDTISYTIVSHVNDVNLYSRKVTYGVCYNNTGNPTVKDETIITSVIDNEKNFEISFLDKGSIGDIIYYKSFVSIDSIPYYGEQKQFKRGLILNGFEYVDLGLSVLWATYNINATKPEHYGDYFAWGETEVKKNYSWDNYSFRTSGFYYYDSYKFSKYNFSDTRGTVDYKGILDLEDDVAHTKWGGDWRMPTIAEYEELLDPNNCIWASTTIDDVPVFKVTSRITGYEGRYIYLTLGSYWSSSLKTAQSTQAKCLSLYSNGYNPIQQTTEADRYCGLKIRPVCQSNEWIKNLKDSPMKLNKDSISMIPNNIVKLTARADIHGQNVYCPVCWSSDNMTVAIVNEEGYVNSISPGKASITASINDMTVSCVVTVREPQKTMEYVDLGLSVKWATCNIGAEKPEDFGYYYAWGETNIKRSYSWSNYTFCDGTNSVMTKYCNNSSYGYNDNKTTLELEDDAAHTVWGGNWRMPTYSEFNELIQNCFREYTTRNGVKGYLFYKPDLNGQIIPDKSIFLPATGDYGETLFDTGYLGLYWSSSLNKSHPDQAHLIYFNSVSVQEENFSRSIGCTIRPVCP